MSYRITIEEITPNRDPEKAMDSYHDQRRSIYEQTTENKINLKGIIDAFNAAISGSASFGSGDATGGGGGGGK